MYAYMFVYMYIFVAKIGWSPFHRSFVHLFTCILYEPHPPHDLAFLFCIHFYQRMRNFGRRSIEKLVRLICVSSLCLFRGGICSFLLQQPALRCIVSRLIFVYFGRFRFFTYHSATVFL
jgi:hypothetical protein